MAILTVALFTMALLAYQGKERKQKELIAGLEETFFKVKKTTKMSKVFDAYASRKGVQASCLRFFLDGERINADQTPKQLEMEEQDQIDCLLEQTGGC